MEIVLTYQCPEGPALPVPQAKASWGKVGIGREVRIAPLGKRVVLTRTCLCL